MKTKILMILVNSVLVQSLSCNEVLELPEDEKISLAVLQEMPPKDILQCLAHLGREELPPPEAEFIWKTIIKLYDGIEFIPDSTLMSLHWVTTAVTPEDYANISLSNIDVIQNFGLNYNLNDDQISAIAEQVSENFAGKEPEDYTYYDLTALGQILCGFNKTQIERIPPLSYKESALLIGKLEHCSAEVMSGFATLAVQDRAFGPVGTWTKATKKIVGKVADFLPQDLST